MTVFDNKCASIPKSAPVYNDRIMLFYLRHIARLTWSSSRSISCKTLSLLKCSPNSTNKSSNCSSVILYFLDQTMKFKNSIASELDEPRISDSSFPCLETSGPAHLMLTQFFIVSFLIFLKNWCVYTFHDIFTSDKWSFELFFSWFLTLCHSNWCLTCFSSVSAPQGKSLWILKWT